LIDGENEILKLVAHFFIIFVIVVLEEEEVPEAHQHQRANNDEDHRAAVVLLVRILVPVRVSMAVSSFCCVSVTVRHGRWVEATAAAHASEHDDYPGNTRTDDTVTAENAIEAWDWNQETELSWWQGARVQWVGRRQSTATRETVIPFLCRVLVLDVIWVGTCGRGVV